MAYQLWMPERSICASLAELDDNQLQIVNRTSHRFLFNATNSKEEEEHSYTTYYKEPFLKWYSKYKKFIELYAFYAEEEMAYRFGGEYGIKEPPETPAIYHCAYHYENNVCCSSYSANSIDKKPHSINLIMRAVLSNLWSHMNGEVTWTKRSKPSWHKQYIKVIESNGVVYGDGLSFRLNKDGKLSPSMAPILEYDWASKDTIKFQRLIW